MPETCAGRLAVAMVAATAIGVLGISAARAATSDDTRNRLAKTGCVRGKFKNYYRERQGGDPGTAYKGRVFKLSEDYPNQLPAMEHYPWLDIPFKDGGPVDPRAYLQAMLDYGLAGNVDVDFYVENNKLRRWYDMPWMDWNTEVASDWPGTDGREFVHGFTHEFDSSGNTLSTLQHSFVDTWSGAYFNERAAFAIGQV